MPPMIELTSADDTDDSFDRERVLELLDCLERDVALVEAAMGHVEAGEHESFTAAIGVLEADTTS
jgi:hypothetical protein